MDLSRRELPFLLALAQSVRAQDSILPSRCYEFSKLPVQEDSKTGAQSRQVLRGTTHDGFPIDLHITSMPPGQMPHPPHHHAHEEMFLVQQGTLEVNIAGRTCLAGPGSVIYVHSNEEHGVKCVGGVPARYFVLALGRRGTE